MSQKLLPFNTPFMAEKSLEYIRQAHLNKHLSGDGPFTKKCHQWLEEKLGCDRALLTHSCTAALEMAAILSNLEPGDEVIMPSYTFVSTANAVVLRGARPVFIDIRPDTLNMDEKLIEAAITPKTKAIMVVHYAGVACEMDTILAIARKHNLFVIEDAAQAISCTYKGKPLGTLGDFGALSFHETKNVISGEGGALLINDPELVGRAEIIREKGTNRSRFFRGQVDKYTWMDIGSSFLPSDLIAAFLWSQIELIDEITEQRLKIWNRYHQAFEAFERDKILVRPTVPKDCVHGGHLYYLLMPNLEVRTEFIQRLKSQGVGTVFHYIPLHSSPAGMKFGRTHGDLSVTDRVADSLVRLPIWIGLDSELDSVIEKMTQTLRAIT